MTARASLLLLYLVATGPALAQESSMQPVITVQGEASQSIVPDTALISLGVVTDRPRAADAATDNAKAVQGVMQAIKAEGIEPRDIQTVSVELSPLFGQPPNDTKVVAFRASNALQIRVKPVDRAGPLIGALFDKGVNSLDGVEFTSEGDPGRTDRLRADAMLDARRKAQVYVAALGLKLGRVLRIDPQSPMPGPLGRFAVRSGAPRAAAAVPVPLEAGQQTAEERVSVTWELVQ